MKKTGTAPASMPPPECWPKEVRRLFWDRDLAFINPRAHRAFVIQRILSSGGLAPLRWLRSMAADEELRLHIQSREGREIEPRRLRFFELILDLPKREVSGWIRRHRNLPAPSQRGGA